jgi:hypothetical protein
MNPEPSVSTSVKGTATALASDAREQTSRLAADTRRRFGSMVSDKKAQTAETFSHLAGAALQAAHRLEEGGQLRLARSAVVLAQKADRIGRYVREKDFRGLAQDAEALARRHRGLFITSTFVAGLVFARFIKSSAQRTRDTARPYDDDLVYGGEA